MRLKRLWIVVAIVGLLAVVVEIVISGITSNESLDGSSDQQRLSSLSFQAGYGFALALPISEPESRSTPTRIARTRLTENTHRSHTD